MSAKAGFSVIPGHLVNTSSFTEGWLKGWRVDGSLRWQDKVAIGYPTVVLRDGAVQSDVLNPFFGPAETNVDLWVGCSRKFLDRIKWSVQLNVRNLGVGDELIPVSSQPDGSAASLRIAEPQTGLFFCEMPCEPHGDRAPVNRPDAEYLCNTQSGFSRR